ncbi:hypothetical protein [Deminuibacter soli]|uniref:DUF5723 domain-containing protein n=1 Tax=Deminuibacter soli TaxID=2291815 RepID=A0A3E1NHD3_9BACT|nr:hypothetical protein [Deminuibacter soli]RFM27376.1 hypothetical protein DXN05_15265 [Deminuibacter soli]
MEKRNIPFYTRNSKAALLVIGLCIGLSLHAQKSAPAHVGLVYPISTNGTAAPQYSNGFSLHAIAGVSRTERNVALAGFSNIILDSARGLQTSGFYNHIGNTAKGVTLAGFANYTRHQSNGVQGAGFLNLYGGGKGLAMAGFGNIVTGRHAQAAYKGVQLAGFMNRAGDVNTQVAGFINIARKVKGVQLAGFINIADSSDYPIGIVNIIKNGEGYIGAAITENYTGLISFRSGGRVLYGILGLAYNFSSEKNRYGLEAGLGAHLVRAKQWRLNTELSSTWLTDFKGGDYLNGALRILPSLRVAKSVAIYGGPTLNFVAATITRNSDLSTHYFWHKTSGDHIYGLYCGVMGGVQIAIFQ